MATTTTTSIMTLATDITAMGMHMVPLTRTDMEDSVHSYMEDMDPMVMTNMVMTTTDIETFFFLRTKNCEHTF